MQLRKDAATASRAFKATIVDQTRLLAQLRQQNAQLAEAKEKMARDLAEMEATLKSKRRAYAQSDF